VAFSHMLERQDRQFNERKFVEWSRCIQGKVNEHERRRNNNYLVSDWAIVIKRFYGVSCETLIDFTTRFVRLQCGRKHAMPLMKH